MKKLLKAVFLSFLVLFALASCDSPVNPETPVTPENPVTPETPDTPVVSDTPSPEAVKAAKELLDSAVTNLKAGDFDAGIKDIEDAYKRAKTDETKTYYVLAKLASITKDENTVKLMQENLGMTEEYIGKDYTGSFEQILDSEFWTNYIEKLMGSFSSDEVEAISDNESTENAENPLLDAIIGANSGGFDDIISKVVGAFENIYAAIQPVAATIAENSVVVPGELIEALELQDFFGEGAVLIGKSEVNIVVAAVGMVKGTLEYLSAFNTAFDLGEVSGTIMGNGFLDIAAIDKINSAELLTIKGTDMLTKSKKSLIEAVDLLMASYDYIKGETSPWPDAAKDVLTGKEANLIYSGAQALRNALQNGDKFYVTIMDENEIPDSWPTEEPEGGDWFAVDCGALFEKDVLNKLLDREESEESGEKEGTVKISETDGFYWINLNFADIVTGKFGENKMPKSILLPLPLGEIEGGNGGSNDDPSSGE